MREYTGMPPLEILPPPPDVPPAAPSRRGPPRDEVPAPPRLRFDRAEWSGALGDLGTDLPLIVGMILAAGLDPALVFGTYGALQILTGVVYRMPMPVQPLKAVAALVIAGGVTPQVLAGGGLSIGVTMLLLAATGLLDTINRVVPRAVVRGIQLGLGVTLGRLALAEFVPKDGPWGWGVAAVALAAALALRGNRRFPPAFAVIPIGAAWAAWRWSAGAPAPVVAHGGIALPDLDALKVGFLTLAIPQLALSLGNSVLATRQVAMDLFPESEPLTLRRIGFTYAAMNLLAPLGGGVPVCHGSGGMCGHHAFGARSGGSVVLYGLFWLAAAAFASADASVLLRLFPGPVLGVLLLVEAVALLALVRDVFDDGRDRVTTLLGGLVAAFAPWGYVLALVGGTVGWHVAGRRRPAAHGG
jgi:hypothetical protein